MTDISLSKLYAAIELVEIFINQTIDENSLEGEEELDDDDREIINALGTVLAAAKKHHNISISINNQLGVEHLDTDNP